MSQTAETEKNTWREAWIDTHDLLWNVGRDRFQNLAIAGSVRRRKPRVGDVELVFIPAPRPERAADLFDGGVAKQITSNAVWDRLDRLVGDPRSGVAKAVYTNKHGKTSHRWGDRYRGVRWRDFRYEFYLADRRNFGAILAIRTGPAAFEPRLMSALRRNGYRMAGGYVRRLDSDAVVDCPDERTLFGLAGLDWLQPEDRR